MRPISGDFNPHDRSIPTERRPRVERVVPLPVVRGADAVVPREPDTELSVHLLADGSSISVRRRVVTEADGIQHTVGIDAIIR